MILEEKRHKYKKFRVITRKNRILTTLKEIQKTKVPLSNV